MLVLSRKVHEGILIGDDIVIEVTRIGPVAVRIAIQAPDDMKIIRHELANKTPQETTNANNP